MKSPNASYISGSLKKARRTRTAATLMLLICPLVFASCQSADSGYSRKPKDNPYAQNDPKTPEEEAYYRDVYSGNWSEESDNGLQSVYKHSASTRMPQHWEAMPPGAKTLEEIRFESSQRKMAEARAMARNLPATSAPVRNTAAMASAPAAPATPAVTSYNAYPTPQNVPAPAPTPAANTYAPTSAPLAQPYAAQAAPQQAPAQYAQSAPAATAPVQAPASAQYASAAPSTQGVQFVAQAPSQPQPTAAPAASAPVQPQPQPQPAAQPAAPAVYPQSQPQQATYPSAGLSASVDLFNSAEWVVRGQEDPFGDDDEDDPFATDDSDDVDDEAEATEVPAAVPAPPAVPSAPEASAAPEVTTENVTVKSVDPAAKAEGASGVVAALRNGGKKLMLKIDPSIAEAFANVHRPTAPSKDGARENYDEYVVTGGDAKNPVVSHKDWSVDNLDAEDSVAHFDTIDGRILTEPSNRVFLYSPRFGAVRQIVGPIEGDHREGIEIANSTTVPVLKDNIEGIDVRTQEERPLGANTSVQPQGAETTVGITISTGLQGVMEGDAQIRLGAMLTAETVDDLSSEDASLMLDGAIAAQGWSGEQGVAVSTDLVNAFSNAYVEGAATVYHIKDDTKTSKLRVIKIANKDAAKPGEFVEFTLRFENIGDQPIGNVTILDNLSARLRYVDGTAQSSMQADFLADLNEKGSLVLRWEIEKPLMPKEFGVIRFICKVQ